MKTKLYYLVVLFFLVFVADINAQAPGWMWAKSMGGSLTDYGHTIVSDLSDNIYLTGRFTGTVDFDPGTGVLNLTSSTSTSMSFFISKSDYLGNLIWAKSPGGTGSSNCYAIKIDDAGNIYGSGIFSGTVDFDPGPGVFNLTSQVFDNMFVLKLDSGGNFIWAKAILGNNMVAPLSLSLDNSGNVYTTGNFKGTCDFDPDSTITYSLTSASGVDIFISKLDSMGNFIWAKKIGGSLDDGSTSIVLGTLGDIYVLGNFEGTVDFDPDVGSFNLTAAGTLGNPDVFILKFDNGGNFIWVKSFRGNFFAHGYSIVLDDSDYIYTSGIFTGLVDFDPGPGTHNIIAAGISDMFISKLDSMGNFVWARKFGGSTDDAAEAITIDQLGNIYATGFFEGTVDFNPDTALSFILTAVGVKDIFILKLDNTGNFIWVKSAGGTGGGFGYSITVNPSGYAMISGTFDGPAIYFDSISISGTSDIFFARLDTAIINGIENVTNDSNLSIYPNPVNDVLNISFNNHLPANSFITINDMQGRIIKEEKISQRNSTIQIDVSTLSQGVYLMRINGQVQRFVKM